MALLCHPFFVLIFLLLSFHTTKAFKFTPNLETAYLAYLNLEIPKGDRIVKAELERNSDNGIVYYVQHLGAFIEVMVTDDPNKYRDFITETDKRLSIISKLDKSSPYYNYCLGEIRMHTALARLNFDEKITGLWNLRQAYKLFQDCNKKYPSFDPALKSYGFLKILIGNIPSEYAWAAQSVGLYGDVDYGLEMIDEVADGNGLFKLEALILRQLILIYLMQNETKAIENYIILSNKYPNNSLVLLLGASTLSKFSHTDELITTLESYQPSNTQLEIYFLNYMMGDAYFNKGEYSKAIASFKKYTDYYKGKNFIKSSYYKSSLSYHMLNDEVKAKEQLQLVTEKGEKLVESDRYAYRMASSADFPSTTMIKARHYFDGGYYNKALLSLKNAKNKIKTDERVEYHYRLGRIYQVTEKYDQSIREYENAIRMNTSKSVSYFIPNSCLQLGYIYLALHDKTRAKAYFEQCLSYKNYDYQSSIETKAKHALKEIKKSGY